MNEKKKRIRRLRLFSMTAVTLIVIIGMIAGLGIGSLSAIGLKNIYSICPIGYLETVVTGWDFMPHLFILFLAIVLLTILLGRFFCGWVCPIPLVRKLFSNKMDEPNDVFLQNKKENSRVNKKDGHKLKDFFHGKRQEMDVSVSESSLVKKESSYGLPILIGVLASSAVFKFPVFCLICPIGLTFATTFALIRLFGFHEPTLDLLIFPAIIFLELALLRKWCGKFCPVGAFLSLISKLNTRFLPTVDHCVCLEKTKGIQCHQCQKACSFDIDVVDGKGSGPISDCSKCKECALNCPVQAIHFPWKKEKNTNTPLRKKN